MSYKPSENDLMAYLYGELENPEREAVEKYLFEHPEAALNWKPGQVRTML